MVVEKPRHQTDLYVRTSWIDAALALAQIDKEKAEGRRTALWFRSKLQAQLYQLGCFIHSHAGKVLFVAILVLSSFCVGLKSAVVHSRVEQLWVEEGGRLESELKYTATALGESGGSNTHQLLIQTPVDPAANLLHPNALLNHLQVLRAASSVTVHLFDITWRLKDICRSPAMPNFDSHYIDQIFDKVIPCTIITPLDCFWEGSKLLGPEPENPVNIPNIGPNTRWTNLNPQKMVQMMKASSREDLNYNSQFPYESLEQLMKRAGISTGYQEKPCLNPYDSECPETAPNKRSGMIPDVGAELTGGCYGFAANYMHWPEDLILGGVKRNKTGHVQRAHALQSVVQLIGDRELYEYWSNTYKVHHVGWNQEKAALVLDTWQRKFSKEVKRLLASGNLTSTSSYEMFAFSTALLNDILSKFSEISISKIAIGYAIVLLYAVLSLLRWGDPVKSQAAIGFAGVILVSVSVAAGLGFCAVLGIPFNASTTQIVPFLALGLGVIDMFLLTHIYAEQSPSESQPDEQTGLLLKKTGLSILLTSLSNMVAFFAAAIIPIPALRVFSLQAGILVLFKLATMLLVFPAILSLDMRRRRSGRVDVLCCCLPGPGGFSQWPCLEGSSPQKRKCPPVVSEKQQAITRALPPDRQQTVTVLAPPKTKPMPADTEAGFQPEDDNELENEDDALLGVGFSWSHLAAWYADIVSRRPVKVMAVLLLIGVLCASVWGVTKVADGLDLTDIVPQGTDEHAFLSAQSRYFGFYNMYAVTQDDFEYPNNQRLLYEYHESFMRVPNIIKNDDGGLPEFWLGLFRDWLIGLQKAFDRDYSRGCITRERWHSNASLDGILAYKLLVQTGHVDNPIDRSLINQVRLVDSEGIINPKAFYNYLSAWVSNDALAYSASQANLRPEPKQWIHEFSDYELKIPKSSPLVYTQLPFYLHGLGDTNKITKMIAQVRELCAKFESRGLPNFPSGIPFLFWEQYLTLRQSLALAVLCALAAVFVVVSVLLVNLVAATMVTASLAVMVLQLLALMGVLGIKLSAIPAVLLILAVGIGVHFTLHLCLSFLTGIGGRERRMRMAVEHMFSPIIHGAFTTLIAVTMLGFSEFDFVVRYFFYILIALIGIGLLNGLVFFPVILSLIGPLPEVIPLTYPDRISTPTPEPVRKIRQPSCRVAAPPRRHHGAISHQCHREPSLTTITEESNSWHSATHEILVEPQFVVETTTTTHPYHANTHGSSNGGSSSGGQRSAPQKSQSHVTTKVTATAKVKVEVHTPVHGGVDSSTYKSRQSRRRDSGSSGSSSSDSSDGAGRHS